MSRAFWILAVLLSHWRRHPMQLATLLIGLISATALWSGVQALNAQARTSYDRAAATFGGARTAMLVGRDHATFPQALFVELRRAGWPVSPVLEGRIQIGGRSFRLLGHRAGHAARRGRQRPDGRTGRPAILRGAAGRNAGGAGSAGRSQSAGRRAACDQQRHLAAAAAGAAATGARRAGGRYRHRPAAPEHAGPGLASLDRQGKRPARGARNHRRRQAASGRAGCGERPRTPHRQFSPQPHRIRPAVLRGRIVHRQFGDRPRLRAAAADAADAARLRRVGAPAERGAGDRAGRAGADRGRGRSGLRLPHRGIAAARCRRVLARTLWRADSGAIDAARRMVGRRPRHQRARCAGGGGRKPARRQPACPCWSRRSRRPGNRRSSAG